ETGESSILGVARLSRLHGLNEAEFGMLINDRYQGRGLGSELLRSLVTIAQAEGLTRIAADILPQNRALTDRDRTLEGAALVVGNPAETPVLTDVGVLPALPGAEQEAAAIANLLNTDPWVGPKVTETAILEQMADKSIIHLATHGLLDFDAILNEFGLPTADEIPSRAETGVNVTP
ncbi:MAG: GNAT family N-acetyltransferase, partial [Cyanobacteria bacterium J06642_11]